MTMMRSARPRRLLDERWSVKDAAELYQVEAWGAGYVAIDDRGGVEIRPHAAPDRRVALADVVARLRESGVTPPLLLRFPDIVGHRLRRLHEAFARAIAENRYRGRYLPVYPIKVNQERRVVEEVFRQGRALGAGLEVGSKPELLAVLALTADAPAPAIICNGFKDESYVEAAMLAARLGRTIIPVIEKPGEVEHVVAHARALGVRPRIGVRAKLASPGAGRWRDSAGARSKFGLSASELLELLDRLRADGLADCLELLHCHPGSQLQDIRRVKDAVAELAHVYAELVQRGAGLAYLDVGGGLGVDYDGSRTNYPSSMNYGLEEYASEIVYRVGSVCDDRGIEHPTIISESGRAIAAYQSVLVFDVLGATRLDVVELPDLDAEALRGDDETPQPILDLVDAHESVSERRLLECYHDAQQASEGAQQLFKLGYLSIELRALADRLFWATCARIRDLGARLPEMPPELEELREVLSDTYYGNFSVFQSIPDSWAIGQVFPIMPIHRLHEEPTRLCTLGDITCDSDGRVDRFVDVREIKRTLAVHELRADEPYHLGVFLVGAYQETLADLHNLFGDTHAATICLEPDGAWRIDEIVRGDSAASVLSYVNFDPDALQAAIDRDCARAVAEGRMDADAGEATRRFYARQLDGYTYLTRP